MRFPAGKDSPRLVVTRMIPEPGMELARRHFTVIGGEQDAPLARHLLLEKVRGADALLCLLTDSVDEKVMDAAGGALKVISNMAVGYDNIDVPAATARGILVTNTPGVLTEATADLTWALILSVARRVVEGDRLVREGGFKQWSPFLLLGHSVAGATLAVVGMGRIGQAVARRAVGFDMRVVYTRRSGPLLPEQVPPGAGWEYRSSLDEILREADIVSLHVPLTQETWHLIGERELALMQPGAILINTSRGPVVDETALVAALREGRLAGAGLDVYEREPELAPGLTTLPQVVLLPHLGSATLQTRAKMSTVAVENLLAFFQGRPVPYPVNPEVLNDARS